jgi:alkylated DNA repair dioxygenase AlkB
MTELPPDFTLSPGNPLEHLTLDELAKLDWLEKTISFYGKTSSLPRLTTMYGHEYVYSGVRHPHRPLPAILESIRDQIESLTGFHANAVLGNLYRDGSDTVGWHSDDDYNATDPRVASVSIGATRRFRIRTKARPSDGSRRTSWTTELTHGSLLLMGPQAQKLYDHHVPRESKTTGPRINLTFRSMGTGATAT